MIDPKSMASARARELGQSEQEWLAVVSGKEFESACAHLSDGEIDRGFRWAQSASEFNAFFGSLSEAFRLGTLTAFDDWRQFADTCGLAVEKAMGVWETHVRTRPGMSFQARLEDLKTSMAGKQV